MGTFICYREAGKSYVVLSTLSSLMTRLKPAR